MLNMTKAEIQARSKELQAREGSLEFIQEQSRETLERLFGIPTDTTFTFNANDYGGFVNTFKAVFVEKNKAEIERERKEKEQKGDTTPIDPLKKTMRSVSHSRPDETAKLLEKVPEEYNVYVGRNTYTQRGRMGTDRLYNYRTAIVDIDAHEIPVEEANALARVCAYELKKEVDAGKFLDIEPTAITETGRGVQIVWSLTPTSGKQKGALTKYKTLATLLCSYIDCWLKERPIFGEFNIDDPVSQNAPGLIRFPSSVNIKAFEALGKDFARVIPYNPQEKHTHNADNLTRTLAQKLNMTDEDVRAVAEGFEAAEKRVKARGKEPKGSSGKSSRKGQEPLSEDVQKVFPQDVCKMDLSHLTPEEAVEFLESHMSCYEHIQRYSAVLKLLEEKFPEGVPVGLRDYALYILGNLLLKFTSISNMFTALNTVCAVRLKIPFTQSDIEALMSTSTRVYCKNGDRGYTISNQYICNILGLNIKSFPRIVDFRKQDRIRYFKRIQKQKIKSGKEAEAKALRAEGLTITEVAKRMNVSERTVYRWTRQQPETEKVEAEAAEQIEQPDFIPYCPYYDESYVPNPEDNILSVTDWLDVLHETDTILPSLNCINEADDLLNISSSFFPPHPDPEKCWNDELNNFAEQYDASYTPSVTDDDLNLTSSVYDEPCQETLFASPDAVSETSYDMFNIRVSVNGDKGNMEEYWNDLLKELEEYEDFMEMMEYEDALQEQVEFILANSEYFETACEDCESYFPTPEEEKEAEILFSNCPLYDIVSGTWVTLLTEDRQKQTPVVGNIEQPFVANSEDDIFNMSCRKFDRFPNPAAEWNDELNDFIEQREPSCGGVPSRDDILNFASCWTLESGEYVQPDAVNEQSDDILNICVTTTEPYICAEKYWDEITEDEAIRNEELAFMAANPEYFETARADDDYYQPTLEEQEEVAGFYSDCPVYDAASGTWVALPPESDEEQAVSETKKAERRVVAQQPVRTPCATRRLPCDDNRLFPKGTETTRTAKKNLILIHPLFLFLAKHIRS